MEQTEQSAGGRHPEDMTDVPTAAEYKEAFKAVRDAGVLKSTNARSIILELLRANYQAEDHTITGGELAAQVGATFREANLRYGNLAKALSKHLNRAPTIKIAILVKFSGGKPGSRPDQDESSRWTLHPEVVKALEESWFAHLQPDA